MFSVLGKCIFIFLDIGVEWVSLISLMGEFAAELISNNDEWSLRGLTKIVIAYYSSIRVEISRNS